MPDIGFSAETVLKYLANPSSTSPGSDKIPPDILEAAAHSLAYLLSIIFNRSYSTGVLPKNWPQANIIPMYKRLGFRHDLGDYRPVALIPVVRKLMESIIKDSIMS